MARTLKVMPRRSGIAGRGGGSYPWDQWLDGRVWSLTQGEDFSCTLKGMRSGAHSAAQRRGLNLSTAIQDKDLIIQATG